MSFLDSEWVTNGTNAMQTWNGGGGDFGTTNAVGAPVAKFIENFRSRAWGANTSSYPSRVYYSSTPSGTPLAITWTGTGTGYIDISPGDGEDITGIKKFARSLLVFKNNFIYPINSINDTEPDPQIFVGTYSQESIVLGKDGVYFHHPSGIYRLRRGETTPKEISRPIYGFIKNIPSSSYENVGGWKDDDHIYESIGDITIDGVSFVNIVARWTISTEVWTIYSYSRELRVGCDYDNGTTIFQIAGDTDGKIYKLNIGKTDDEDPIHYSLITQWYNLTGLRSKTTTITKLAGLCKNAQGSRIEWQNQDDSYYKWHKIGQLEKTDTIFDSQNIRGNKIRFRLSGSSSGDPFIFQGLEILTGVDEGVVD